MLPSLGTRRWGFLAAYLGMKQLHAENSPSKFPPLLRITGYGPAKEGRRIGKIYGYDNSLMLSFRKGLLQPSLLSFSTVS